MCCPQRHVLRHGWHFPSWPKVLLAHCSQAGLGAGAAGAPTTVAGKQGGSVQNYAFPFLD